MVSISAMSTRIILCVRIIFNCFVLILGEDDDDNESDIQLSKSKLSKANIDGRKASASRPQRGSNLSASSRDSGDNSKSQQQPSYWQMAKDGYEELVNAIIRPPRYDHYKISDLGSKVFRLEGKYYERKDMELVNKRGMKLQCSHWLPSSQSGSKTTKPIPCIIYLHGNSSCRLEAMDSLPTVLGAGCSLFALDCAGSGKSDGEFISLGVYEREDVQCAVDYLRSNPDLVSGVSSFLNLFFLFSFQGLLLNLNNLQMPS